MLNDELYVNRLTYKKSGAMIASTNNKHTDFGRMVLTRKATQHRFEILWYGLELRAIYRRRGGKNIRTEELISTAFI